MIKKLIIASDHRGFQLKQLLTKLKKISSHTVEWIDVGAYTDQRSDYPVFAKKALKEMRESNAFGSILLCGSGVGMAIAANREPGVYAAVAFNPEIAQKAKEDDNINVIALPADSVTFEQAYAIIVAWLDAVFKEGRYADRLILIDAV